MVKYKCRKCGGEMEYVILTSLPPIHQYTCSKCGRIHQDRPDENIIVI